MVLEWGNQAYYHTIIVVDWPWEDRNLGMRYLSTSGSWKNAVKWSSDWKIQCDNG